MSYTLQASRLDEDDLSSAFLPLLPTSTVFLASFAEIYRRPLNFCPGHQFHCMRIVSSSSSSLPLSLSRVRPGLLVWPNACRPDLFVHDNCVWAVAICRPSSNGHRSDPRLMGTISTILRAEDKTGNGVSRWPVKLNRKIFPAFASIKRNLGLFRLDSYDFAALSRSNRGLMK